MKVKDVVISNIRDIAADPELIIDDGDTLESLGFDSLDAIDFSCQVHLELGHRGDVRKFNPLLTVADVVRELQAGVAR